MPAWPRGDGAQCLAVQDRGDRLITRKLDMGHSGERPPSTAVRVTRGHAPVDCELYLSKSWTDDPERCRAARIPQHCRFGTKNELARTMVLRALGYRAEDYREQTGYAVVRLKTEGKVPGAGEPARAVAPAT
ncbi:transposase [Streptomyces sp. NPDC051664]|uniref:transposase n=1 Tax=Streptomyces sp. NPDC051664 TaxID=3365668 RepID=UPI0037B90800